MTKKKSIIKKLANEFEFYYNKPVEILYIIQDAAQINNLIKNSNSDKILLIPKNENTKKFFTDTKDLIIIYNNHGIEATKKINVKLCLNDITLRTHCNICTIEYITKTSNNIRSCSNCSKDFCIKCQIKIMIQSVQKQDNFKKNINIMTCPFCRYEHMEFVGSFKNFMDSLFIRFEHEMTIGTLDEDDINEILKLFE